MPRQTKDQIAEDMYGVDFEDLSAGEKAQVTRRFNAQPAARATTRAAPAVRAVGRSGAIRAEVGRIGVNGTKACVLEAGATVQDLITQAQYTLDTKKENVVAHSNGNTVRLTDLVVDGETYIISPQIKSA